MVDPDRSAIGSNQRCYVCDDSITYSDTLREAYRERGICRSPNCAHVMARETIMTPSTFDQYVAFQRNLIKKARTSIADRNKRIAEIEKAHEQENQRLVARMLQREPNLSPNDIQVLRLPSGRRASAPLPLARMQNYLRHLYRVIDNAFSAKDDIEFSDDRNADEHQMMLEKKALFRKHPDLHELSDQACALCKGGCCTEAGDTAYLTEFSIRKLRRTNADLLPIEILNLYVNKLQAETLDGACINQTISGCSLPRQLRADLCNSFHCGPLEQLHENHLKGTKVKRVIAIQRRSGYWDRIDPRVENPVISVTLLDNAISGAEPIDGVIEAES